MKKTTTQRKSQADWQQRQQQLKTGPSTDHPKTRSDPMEGETEGTNLVNKFCTSFLVLDDTILELSPLVPDVISGMRSNASNIKMA
eukprot:scaffold9940_cov161-Amphora_coffeaeformis.AAC.5